MSLLPHATKAPARRGTTSAEVRASAAHPAGRPREGEGGRVELRAVTKDTTTLHASDRDAFLFLVDDLHPIEAGRLPDGSPDLFFRGFYRWNSEVGAETLGMASFHPHAVCRNRNLWGVEDFEEITIRHSKYARLALRPRGGAGADELRQFVAPSHEDRSDFLRRRGVGPKIPRRNTIGAGQFSVEGPSRFSAEFDTR